MGVRKYIKQSDRARAALLLSRQQYEVSELAEFLGCRRQTLSKFLNGGRVRPSLVDLIEKWTRAQGYWLWDDFIEPTAYPADYAIKGAREAQATYPSADAYWRGLAQELRTVADIIESSAFDDVTKFTRVESTVGFLGQAIASAQKLVEEDQRRDL